MDINPIMTEINGLSPAAQAALGMAGHKMPTGSPQTSALMPQDAGPAPAPSLMTMPSTAPSLGAPAMPKVSAPLGTITGDTNARSTMLSRHPGVENISHDIQVTGFGSAHPFLGKLLGGITEGAGLLGDTLLHAASPRLEQLVPGTEGNYTRNLGRLNTSLAQDETNAKDEATDANLGATTQHTQAETANIPEEETDKHALAQSTVSEHNAQASNLLHPQAKTAFEAWQVQNPGKPIEDWLADEAKAKASNEKPDPAKQQYIDEYQKSHPGGTIAQALHQFAIDTQPPQRAPITNVFIPDGKGGYTVEGARAGSSVAPGAQTSAGVNAINTPTTQQRTAASRAQTVVQMAPEVIHEIDQNSAKLGPLMGRWGEFMQGKVGMDNPDFAGLRTDLMMLSTGVALAHAQGRLPENLREEFDHAINSPKQTPANLKATIQHILPWMQKMQEAGNPNASPSNDAGGTVENYVRDSKGKLVKGGSQ